MMMVAIILGALYLISGTALIGLCIYCFSGRSRVPDELSLSELAYRNGERFPAPEANHSQPPATICSHTPMSVAYEELERATNGFCDANVVGEGGFGRVYKGIINGVVVAVKKLKAGSGQGDHEFQAEIEFISRVHHRYLVDLVGYCIHGEQRMLVYVFVANNSLKVHLHGKERPTIEWSKRMIIAVGSAKGLEYLHEQCNPRIIHRDVKSDNILLDDNLEPKLADFGLAKFFPDAVTHVSTVAKGTPGYMDPDYFNTFKLTDKSDVYSYGVVLLELISGRRPIEGDVSLVKWAIPQIEQASDRSMYDALIDPKLQRSSYDFLEMERMIFCAAACVNKCPQHRPQMSQVVRALEGTISAKSIWKLE